MQNLKSNAPHKVHGSFVVHNNLAEEFKSDDGFYHYVVDGQDLLAGLKVTFFRALSFKDYQYETAKGVCGYVTDGQDVLAGLGATNLVIYGNGYYEYRAKGYYHFIVDGVDVLKGLKAIYCRYDPAFKVVLYKVTYFDLPYMIDLENNDGDRLEEDKATH